MGGRGTRKEDDVMKHPLDLTCLLWRGEISALPSSLAGKITVCVWDHVGPP